jgi:DNA adenine methylase
MTATVRPPFQYFGGKTTLAPRIAALLPTHRHYVEPYAGSLAVLLAKGQAPMETVNDIDGDLMLFWRTLRDQPDALLRACALTPHARAEHELSYTRDQQLDDVERARRVWVCLTQGRGGTLRSTGWRHYVKPAGNTGFPAYLEAYVQRMGPVLDRLHRVSLECRPALDVARRYSTHPDVLLYVDPPYLGDSRSFTGDPRRRTQRYQHEMLEAVDHEQLLDALLSASAAVVLSGYSSELYDAALAGWHRTEFLTGTGQSARGEWSKRIEVLWSNRPFTAAAVS